MRARRSGSSVVEMPFNSSTTVLAAPHFVRNHVRTRIIAPSRPVPAGAGPCGFFVGLVPTPSGSRIPAATSWAGVRPFPRTRPQPELLLIPGAGPLQVLHADDDHVDLLGA